jgi:predicted ATPase
MRAIEAELWAPLHLGALAQGYGQDGRAEEGLRVTAEALAIAEKNGERWNEAELYRLQGELTLEKFKVQGSEFNGEEEAEACFHEAINIARDQHAKSWELRAATSLARLWQGQGKQAEARELLAPIYNWFTEGFDTADLKDAKALLDTLSEGV